MSKNPVLYKSLVVGVIALFLGLAVQPAIATVQPETEIDIEPKDYLFQTIIDIANNPEVKELFEQQSYDIVKVDIDRSVYRKILFRNPKLFHSLMSIKPCLTYDSLDSLYKHGIKIIELIGEDKSLEIMESIYNRNKHVHEEFNNIIENDEELSRKIYTLDSFNVVVSSTGITQKLLEFFCSILLIISMGLFGIAYGIAKFFGTIMDIFLAMGFNRLAEFFSITGLAIASPFLVLWLITFFPVFACFYDPPYDG